MNPTTVVRRGFQGGLSDLATSGLSRQFSLRILLESKTSAFPLHTRLTVTLHFRIDTKPQTVTLSKAARHSGRNKLYR